MSEVEALLSKADRYLESAELLLDAGDPDSCVSRAYYAMFYAAEATLLDEGRTYDTHKGLISGFGKHLVQGGPLDASLGRDLAWASQKRDMGDYDTQTIPEDEAEEVAERAGAFVGAIRDHLEPAA